MLKRSKFWALALTATMVFSLLPAFVPPAVHAASGGTTIDVSDTSPPALGAGWVYEAGVFTILDGADVTVTGSTTEKRIVVECSAQATVRLSGASIDVSDITNACAFDTTNADVTLILTGDNNTLKSNGDAAGLHVGPNAKLTVTGSAGDGSETGTLNVYGGAKAAGIGGNGGKADGEGEAGGSITINGGTIDATGSTGADGDGGGAGIGGGYQGDGGLITINGGMVTATVGSYDWGAAAIGGGGNESNDDFNGGEAGTIVINGGTVIANGPDWSAGIGSGYTPKYSNNNGKITINGGTVTATSASYGAGIGGAAAGGKITITGGLVTAYSPGGLDDPAAIGGGTAAGTIEITGGGVVATNGTGPGIGGGAGATAGSIGISGGSVIATGGGVGIGNNGSTATTISNSVVFATAIKDAHPQDGVAYGSAVTITPDGTPPGKTGTLTLKSAFTVPLGAQLVVPPGWTLDLNSQTLTNSGSILNLGTIIGTVTGTVYTALVAVNSQSPDKTIVQGSNGESLFVQADAYFGSEDANKTLTYQWYETSSTDTTMIAGTAIPDATAATYTPPSGLDLGDHYYYAVVTAAGAQAPATSPRAIKVSVVSALPSVAPGCKDFGTAPVGYDKTAFTRQFTITNPGTESMTGVKAAVITATKCSETCGTGCTTGTGCTCTAGDAYFEIATNLSQNEIAAGGSDKATVSVRPKTGLAPSATPYRGKLRVTADNGFSLNIPLAFTVEPTTTNITLDAGTDGTSGSAIVTYGSTILTTYTAATKTGYTLTGYFTADTGGDEVITEAGALVADVSGYTDGSGKWTNTDLEATLYARWTANTTAITLYKNGGTANGGATATYDSSSLTGFTGVTRGGATP